MMLSSRALAAHGHRRVALTVRRTLANVLHSTALFSMDSGVPPSEEKHKEVDLPSHIKFRMPDLDFKEVGSGAGDTTLTKWYVQEGAAVTDGTHMCEIDTPDLCFQLESGDDGFVARLLVNEGSSNVAPGQPLAIIVPTAGDIEPFVKILTKNPRCIEGATQATEPEVATTPSAVPPTESAVSSDVLRMLNKLHKEGRFENEKALKMLKSLARKNDEQLLTTYKASYEDGVLEEVAFDKAFFVENALELAEEAATHIDPNAK